MIKYTYQFDDNSPMIEMTLSSQSTWDEALEAFHQFLLGAGYKITGQFELVQDDEGGSYGEGTETSTETSETD